MSEDAKDPELTPEEKIAALTSEVNTLRNGYRDVSNQHARASRDLEHANSEIVHLKDELHRMTVESARLEGYISRTREFDPPETKAQEPKPRDYWAGNDEAQIMGAYGREQAPWYRRG